MEPGKQKKKQIRVADWMTESVLAVETFDSISIARQLMAKHRINQLPVLDNDVLVGIVTDRDLRDAYPTSMMIDRGETQFFVGKEAQTDERVAGAHPPGRHIGQQGLERSPIHAAEATGSRYW